MRGFGPLEVYMAVAGPWVGSSAVINTGQNWMGGAAQRLRMGIPFWMSNMIGRSVEVIHTLGADHNFNGQWFRDRCFEAGSAPIVFNITGDLVSYSRDVPLFFMYGDTPNEYVQLNIHGVTMYGRGGNGWAAGAIGASDGGVCIQNDIGGRLRINNGGAIAGGGGGGGGYSQANNWAGKYVCGGGGGRPFGLGGNNGARWPGGNASLTAPGAGGNTGQYWAGGGGEVGQPGQYANPGNGYSTPPTNPGAAVAGSAPTWQNVGAVYGSRV